MKETKFKQTEVGMIPSDWEVKTLGSLTDKCSYGVGAEARVYCGDVKYIRITDIDDESHRFSPSPITSPSFFQEKHIVQKNDLLVARTGASVGKSYLYDEKDGKLVYAGFLMKLNVFNADSKYVFYNTLTKSYWNWVASESARTGQPGLNLQQMKLYSIALPPTIEEQQRIANALSDVDSLIANLEKLIAKKKNIKQGAMQQLLTGKNRLPGFGSDERTGSRPTDERREMKKGNRHCEERSDAAIQSGYKMTEVGFIPNDWIVEPLANIANTASGGTPSRSKETFYKGPIKWFTTTELRDCNLYDSVEHISKQAVECSSAKIFPKDTLLMAMYGATIGKLGLLKCDAATNQACCAIFPKKTDVLYLYYFLLYNRENIIAMGCGAGQPNVSQEIVKKINIPLPPTVKEQTAIANVLSDMDAEISALETKLAKYRTLKTGMMQQLLTGKARLI
ncbi:MAG: restriction endonuclease subunit S [Fibrobacter sp.]|nr:restriction endonuclease subunit S [Fibrobacter sp.]